MKSKAAAFEIAPFLLATVASASAIQFGLFDRFCMWARASEAHGADEYAGTIFFFILAMTLWAWRRAATVSARLQEATALAQLESILARQDGLTKLANRRAFVEAIEAGCAGEALLLIDLDSFKSVNDDYGHLAGDRVLIEVGRRLRELEDERLIVAPARIGGDEFACLTPKIEEDALRKLVARLTSPVAIGDESISVSVSIGATKIGARSTFDELVREADAAMYSAKRSGGATVFVPSANLRGAASVDIAA